MRLNKLQKKNLSWFLWTPDEVLKVIGHLSLKLSRWASYFFDFPVVFLYHNHHHRWKLKMPLIAKFPLFSFIGSSRINSHERVGPVALGNFSVHINYCCITRLANCLLHTVMPTRGGSLVNVVIPLLTFSWWHPDVKLYSVSPNNKAIRGEKVSVSFTRRVRSNEHWKLNLWGH